MKQKEISFCLSVAGHSFLIHANYSRIFFLSKEYHTDNRAEKEIIITEDDIDAECDDKKSYRTAPENAQLETLAVYRKISKELLEYDIFLMHGAVIAYNENAYMFTAASGTGKTTHIRKWLQNLEEAYVVNGDKPLIKVTNDEIIAFGTPWCGKERLGTNCMVPLRAIVLMERGENNAIHEISFEEAFLYIFKQTYLPHDADLTKKTLNLLSKLKGKVKFYQFSFNNMKEDAFEVAYNAITKA